MQEYLRHREAAKSTGKQDIKTLLGQKQGVSRIPIAQTDLKGFEKAAKKYGVDFAITKDKTLDPPQYTVFFKAHDADALNAALEEYGREKMTVKEKPSVLQMHHRLQEKAKAVASPVREKKQERER